MSTPFAPGEIVAGKYRIDRVLGQGGMGMVLAARHLQLDDLVAIKVLHPMFAAHPSHVERFSREGRAAVKIKSEHVARVSDIGTLEGGSPYMVMEYLEGCDLGEHLRRCGRLPPEVAVRFVLQACEALAEAHAAGIVHRDLKPANLFLTHRADGSPCVKVLDFGISKLLEGDTALTSTHGMVGSPQYMSPEQLHSPKGVDLRTDIWALGAILFELVTGGPPYVAESVTALVMKVSQEAPPKLRDHAPDAPEDLEAAIDACLQRDREARLSSVADLAERLVAIAPEDGARSIERIRKVVGGRVTRVPGDTAATNDRRTTPAVARSGAASSDAAGTRMVASSSLAPTSAPRGLAIPLTFVGVGLVAVAAVLLLRKGDDPPPAPAATPPSAATATTAPPPTTAASSAPVVAPVPVPATAEPSASAAASAGKPGPSRPAGGPATATTAPKPAAPGCDPPYTIDADGHRKYKPQCL